MKTVLIMRTVFFGFVLFGFVGSANAHHSFGYHFDPDRVVSFSGTVREFRFINPHAHVVVDVRGANGQSETWTCEFRGANGLARTGWRADTFQPGQTVEITGFGARRNPRQCYFDFALLADGTRITHDDPIGSDPFSEGEAVRVATRGDVPNFAGVWGRPAGGGLPGGGRGPAPGMPNRFARVLSGAGQRALEVYDPIVDDPSIQCNPVSLMRLWGTGNPTQITQEGDVFTIHHEWMDAERPVYLGMSEHPEGIADRVLGHSIGRFEGSTLIVDTVAYEPGVLFQFPGLPHSNQLHTVERLTLAEDGRTFQVSWTAEDSEYFTEEISGSSRPLQRLNTTLRPYDCTHPEVD